MANLRNGILVKVSIITIVRNSEKYIERTIESILRQTYDEIEYIIIDGASTDRTLAIVKKYENSITKIISEKDSGISDAWNKGISLATGSVIGLLNAGDEYEPDAVDKAVTALAQGADLVYGDTDIVDDSGRLLRKNKGRFHLWKYSGGIGFYHPSLFARKSLYVDIGLFDVKLKYAMDVDWIIRVAMRNLELRHTNLKVRMVDGGVSVGNRYLAYGEYLQALKKNNVADSSIYLSMINTGFRGLIRSITR